MKMPLKASSKKKSQGPFQLILNGTNSSEFSGLLEQIKNLLPSTPQVISDPVEDFLAQKAHDDKIWDLLSRLRKHLIESVRQKGLSSKTRIVDPDRAYIKLKREAADLDLEIFEQMVVFEK
jgi:hypothetical protein